MRPVYPQPTSSILETLLPHTRGLMAASEWVVLVLALVMLVVILVGVKV